MLAFRLLSSWFCRLCPFELPQDHALRIVQCWHQGNYIRFNRLYRCAPNRGQKVMVSLLRLLQSVFFCDHFCVDFCVFRLESFIARIFIQHRLLVLLLTPLVNL